MRAIQGRQLFVVAGTGTDVGKTWVACHLAQELAAWGLDVAARKLAQSFVPGRGATDVELLAGATGEKMSAVCPPWRWYPLAMAPPMAAESLGCSSFTLADLISEVHWPHGQGVTLVEQAGGVGSPQAVDGHGVDLADLLAPDAVVLVASAGFGTLSQVTLAARACRPPAGRFLNRYRPDDELHVANHRWLASRAGLAVTSSVGELASALVAHPERAGGQPDG